MGSVETRREEWYNVVHHCVILVAQSSARPLVEATSGGSGRRLGMGSGGNCDRVGAASEGAGDYADGKQRPSKKTKEIWQRVSTISKAVSITLNLLHLRGLTI